MEKRYSFYLIIIFALLLNGCASFTNVHRDNISNFDNMILNNICDFSFIDRQIKKGDDIILWSIQGGTLAKNCGNFEKSINYFDRAEYHYKYDVDLISSFSAFGRKTTSLALNNNLNSYDGNIYEKILVNTYKGIDFLVLNDKANARVEFNRALERQIIAKEYFSKEIETQIKDNEENIEDLGLEDQNSNTKEQYNSQGINFNDTQKNILKKFINNPNSMIYPDFINPFTTYISALFLMLDDSYERAYSLFRENLEMDPNNPQIQKDFKLSDTFANSPQKRKEQKYVWLIYESGLGPAKYEERVDLPIFLFSNSLYYTGIALPKLYFRNPSYEHLSIKNNSNDISRTYIIADVDSIVAAEFNKRFKMIATEAVISATLKTVAQKQLNDIHQLAGAIATIFQIFTTKADVRNWSSLPKNFQAASIPIKDGNIAILNEKNEIIFKDKIKDDKDIIIYLKSAHEGQVIVDKIYF